MAGGFSVVREGGFFAAGLVTDAAAAFASAGLLPLTLAGGFATAASGAIAGISFFASSFFGATFCSSFFGSAILGAGATFSTTGFSTGAALAAAILASGVGSGMEAAVVFAAATAGFVSLGGAGFACGLEGAACGITGLAKTGEATGEGMPSFFCVPMAILGARFFLAPLAAAAGTKVGGAIACSGDGTYAGIVGCVTVFGVFGLGVGTALGLLIALGLLMGLATTRVGEGDDGGGGAESPSKPNNLSVTGAETRGDGCCVGGATGIVCRVATGLPVGGGPPFAVPLETVCLSEFGEGGTYPVEGALKRFSSCEAEGARDKPANKSEDICTN